MPRTLIRAALLRRRGLGFVAVLVMLLLAWKSLPGEQGDGREAGVSAPSTSAPAAAASAGRPTASRRASSALAGASAAPAQLALAADERAAMARHLKAGWCGFGAEQRRQLWAAADAASGAASNAVVPDAAMALSEVVATELLAEASAQVAQRWVRQLTQRGDPRSQALADHLSTDGEAAARLQRRARSSSDPMVTIFALLKPCAGGACINVEASQWSRLEPANLQAWLALLNGPSSARRNQQGYVLERAASEARYSNSYQQEFATLLLSLPQTEMPGLQAQAEADLINGMVAAWPVSSFQPLLETCRNSQVESGVTARCAAVAGMLWPQSDVMHRTMALALVRATLPARPELRASWDARAREYEAVSQWTQGALQRIMQRLLADGDALVSRCGALPEQRRMQREAAVHNDWERARLEMNEAGANEAELATQWREAQGRTALDPPRRPASAAKG